MFFSPSSRAPFFTYTRHQLIISVLINTYTHAQQHRLFRDWPCQNRQTFWTLNISYLYIGLIPPVCILTQQMGGEMQPGPAIALWGNLAVSFSLSFLLTSCVERKSNFFFPFQGSWHDQHTHIFFSQIDISVFMITVRSVIMSVKAERKKKIP